ncbi:MAG: hypothetical protein PHS49_03990 [Candidatus Gracilibacteria bacterium]|nr:hypothetical protein [Candidatus Gracilibacteria bacterium]
MSIEKNKINPNILDKDKLLKQLAIDIANKFGIEKNKAEELIKNDTFKGLEGLKTELLNQTKSLNNSDLEKLFFTIKGAQELIENSSKIEIQLLKQDIEKSINIEEFKSKIEDYLPAKLIEKAKNPSAVHEHILGFALGSANSIFTTVEYLYQIGKGILLAPYHIYLIVSGKGESDSFKDI